MQITEQQVARDTIVRAWKDEEYRASLPEEIRREIPARPQGGGGAALSDQELEAAAGGITPGAAVIAAAAGKAALGGAAGGATFWGLEQAFGD